MVIAVIALIASLSGTAWAALAKNSVGSRQIKPQAVKTSKFAPDAVTGGKVAKGSLTADDIDLTKLGTVPSAIDSVHASNATTLGGKPAVCPDGTVLVRGTCFDLTTSGPVTGLKTAADACAAKGGYLPSPVEAIPLRSAIDLGDGVVADTGKGPEAVGSNWIFTDSIYANTVGVNWRGTIVSGTAIFHRLLRKNYEVEAEQDSEIATYKYLCGYPLIR